MKTTLIEKIWLLLYGFCPTHAGDRVYCLECRQNKKERKQRRDERKEARADRIHLKAIGISNRLRDANKSS